MQGYISEHAAEPSEMITVERKYLTRVMREVDALRSTVREQAAEHQRREQEMKRHLRKVDVELESLRRLVEQNMKKGKRNEERRRLYQEKKERENAGKVHLPDTPILAYRLADAARFKEWGRVGMRFAAANRPEDFATWLVHSWNNDVFLKKPITFSGSSFRIWNGATRTALGALDLLNYSERKNLARPFRNKGEHDDFQKRPWWDWSHNVLFRVTQHMDMDKAPERFQRCIYLLIGSLEQLEVLPELYWDFNESMDNLNRMLRRVGLDFNSMLKAVFTGLRARENPVAVPE